MTHKRLLFSRELLLFHMSLRAVKIYKHFLVTSPELYSTRTDCRIENRVYVKNLYIITIIK